MGWKILFEIGIKKILNPVNLIMSIYLLTIFIFKRRQALLIDIKSFFQKTN